MITIHINEETTIGKKLLKTIEANPSIGNIDHPSIKRDKNGKPLNCFSPTEAKSFLYQKLSETFGEDFNSL